MSTCRAKIRSPRSHCEAKLVFASKKDSPKANGGWITNGSNDLVDERWWKRVIRSDKTQGMDTCSTVIIFAQIMIKVSEDEKMNPPRCALKAALRDLCETHQNGFCGLLFGGWNDRWCQLLQPSSILNGLITGAHLYSSAACASLICALFLFATRNRSCLAFHLSSYAYVTRRLT